MPEGQKLPMGQVVQTALEVAPLVGLKVPGGQGVGGRELDAQKLPGGHSRGMPVKQLNDAGQSTQVRVRMRLLYLSPTYTAPEGLTVTPEGLRKRDAMP